MIIVPRDQDLDMCLWGPPFSPLHWVPVTRTLPSMPPAPSAQLDGTQDQIPGILAALRRKAGYSTCAERSEAQRGEGLVALAREGGD